IVDGVKVRNLEGDAAAELDVFGQVDGPHAALAEFVEDAVASELLGQDRIGRHGTQNSARAGNTVREILFTYSESLPQRKPKTRTKDKGRRTNQERKFFLIRPSSFVLCPFRVTV